LLFDVTGPKRIAIRWLRCRPASFKAFFVPPLKH
jgi:hypothetical protein